MFFIPNLRWAAQAGTVVISLVKEAESGEDPCLPSIQKWSGLVGRVVHCAELQVLFTHGLHISGQPHARAHATGSCKERHESLVYKERKNIYSKI